MFVGHYAVAFGVKRWVPALSLGTLFLACQLADLLWPNLVLLGLERVEIAPGATAVTPLEFASYPYSHSLLGLTLWGAAAAGVYLLARRGSARAAVTLAAVVVSHWVLDVVAHRPDLPLTFGGATRLGLGVWRSLPATLAIEGTFFALGIGLYARSTRALDRVGSVALWALAGFLAVVYIANLFGPPPPSVAAVVWSAQAMWLFVAWGYWVDRHRVPLDGPPPAVGKTPPGGSGRPREAPAG